VNYYIFAINIVIYYFSLCLHLRVTYHLTRHDSCPVDNYVNFRPLLNKKSPHSRSHRPCGYLFTVSNLCLLFSRPYHCLVS